MEKGDLGGRSHAAIGRSSDVRHRLRPSPLRRRARPVPDSSRRPVDPARPEGASRHACLLLSASPEAISERILSHDASLLDRRFHSKRAIPARRARKRPPHLPSERRSRPPPTLAMSLSGEAKSISGAQFPARSARLSRRRRARSAPTQRVQIAARLRGKVPLIEVDAVADEEGNRR